jgi:hypothetical protein
MFLSTNLEIQALKAAYPFGGCALLFHADVVKGLESRGLVKIVCWDPLDESIGYVLTPAGKDVLKTM